MVEAFCFIERMESLSSWRAWIEILLREGRLAGVDGRSPHGERGLKSGFGLILADRVGRSPHGERGLKCRRYRHRAQVGTSLSSWRAWIEIGYWQR